ncbi:hypothetical protein [Desulfolutivibrio sulfoxidireducens]|uniref:hypothetical protein n=1 Tax=Desulfolutivibrio sulfoxidireducens TaxID=2773299 RepID=UPI00159EA30E|nr:hypothetical protein [Desulfolutivibrio sulfoxidireducens]QLA15768.1 hypothetical protein GD605_06220 [Desulfolutivibrio sulfoxidireducens]
MPRPNPTDKAKATGFDAPRRVRPFSPRGSALLYVIASIALLGALGGGVAYFSSSSSTAQVSQSPNAQAYFLSLSGKNYANATSGTTGSFQLGDGSFTLTGDMAAMNSRGTSYGGTGREANFDVTFVPESSPYGPNLPPTNRPGPVNTFSGPTLNLENPDDVVSIEGYVSTGGVHQYWATFTKIGDFRHRTTEDGCDVGYHVATITAADSATLKDVYDNYGYVSYDVQVKMGWLKYLDYAASGINFRWYNNEGYGLSFLSFESKTGCGDYIPHGVKPGPGNSLRDELLVVLWEQRGGVKKWLGYAVVGTPYNYGTWWPPTSEDPKIVGQQDSVDGYLNDNATLVVRVVDVTRDGNRVTEVMAFYADASPYFTSRTYDAVATNILRKRYPPEWIDSSLFPSWPSNLFVDNTSGVKAYWNDSSSIYDYFTMLSSTPQSPSNTVRFIMNASATNATLLSDGCTVRLTTLPLTSFPSARREIGIHAMGHLYETWTTNYSIGFDDLAVQVIGKEE